MTLLFLFILCCAVGVAYHLHWQRTVSPELRASDEDLLGPEFMAEDELLAEFHKAGIILPEEKLIYRKRGDRITVGPAVVRGLADEARQHGYLAQARQMDMDRLRYQQMLNQQQFPQGSQLLETMAQQQAKSQGILHGLGGGIGSALGGLGGHFGQAMVQGGPARFGGRDD